MRVLFDTSVLVAAIVEPHPRHSEAARWLARAHSGEIDFVVASHSLAELYSVLSTLPAKPKISPTDAWRLVHDNVATRAELAVLSASDYIETLRQASERGLSGGVIYDALIFRAARIANVNRLLTLNGKDFRRISPESEALVLAP